MTESTEDSFLVALVSDVQASLRRQSVLDNQGTRRDVTRTTFAAIEGLVWGFREEIIDAAVSTYGLEEAEKAVLSETTFSLSDNGKISEKPTFNSLVATLRLCSRIAHRINSKVDIEFSDKEWNYLLEAKKIRNRVTHPKSLDDLHLSQVDVLRTVEAFHWLFEKLTDVLETTIQTRSSYLGSFEDVLSKLKDGDPEVTNLYNALAAARD
jgi:hypothetical protein